MGIKTGIPLKIHINPDVMFILITLILPQRLTGTLTMSQNEVLVNQISKSTLVKTKD